MLDCPHMKEPTIRFTIREAAERIGIKTGYAFMKYMGLDTKAAYRYWNGNVENLTSKNLARLCFMLKCQPKDLIVYQPPK